MSNSNINLYQEKQIVENGKVTVVLWQIKNFGGLMYQLLTDEKTKEWTDLLIYADEIVIDNSGDMDKISPAVEMGNRNSITIVARKIETKGGEGFHFINQPYHKDIKVNLLVQEYIGPPFVLMTGAYNPITHKEVTSTLPNVDQPLVKTQLTLTEQMMKGLDIPDEIKAKLQSALNVIYEISYFKEILSVILGKADSQKYETQIIDNAEFVLSVRLSLNMQKDKITPTVLERPLTDWAIGSNFYWLLNHTYQQALLENYHQEISKGKAINMYEWIIQNTKGIAWKNDGVEMDTLATQCAGEITRLSRPPANYVPLLSEDTYSNIITNLLDAAQKIESNYNTFTITSTQFETQKDNAKLIQSQVESQKQYVEDTIKLLGKKIKAAEENLKANTKLVSDQVKYNVNNAQVDFQFGLEQKKVESIEKGVFQAVVSLGSIAAGGAGLATSIGSLSEAIETISKALEELQKIMELAEKIEKISKLIKDGDKDPTKGLNLPNASQVKGLSDADWDNIKVRFVGMMKTAIDQGVEGAQEYQTAVKVMVNYGHAVCKSMLSITDLKSRLVQQRMKLKMYDLQNKKIQSFINSSELKEEQQIDVARLFRQRYLDVKRYLLDYIQDYNNAYRYWAMQEPQSASMTLDAVVGNNKTNGSMNMALVSLQNDKVNAYKNWNSVNQDVKCYYSYELVVTSAQLKKHKRAINQRQQLQNGEVIAIQINEAEEPFAGWGDIRIHEVEVYFRGLSNIDQNMGKQYLVKIDNSGIYNCRLQDYKKTFVAEHVNKMAWAPQAVNSLTEEQNFDTNKVITVSGQNLSTQESILYNPGLFSTWYIQLPQNVDNNSELDFSTTTHIQLILHGTARLQDS